MQEMGRKLWGSGVGWGARTHGHGVYRPVRAYSAQLGFKIGAHVMRARAMAATNPLDHQADIAKVQEWLGHANIATTHFLAATESSHFTN